MRDPVRYVIHRQQLGFHSQRVRRDTECTSGRRARNAYLDASEIQPERAETTDTPLLDSDTFATLGAGRSPTVPGHRCVACTELEDGRGAARRVRGQPCTMPALRLEATSRAAARRYGARRCGRRRGECALRGPGRVARAWEPGRNERVRPSHIGRQRDLELGRARAFSTTRGRHGCACVPRAAAHARLHTLAPTADSRSRCAHAGSAPDRARP